MNSAVKQNEDCPETTENDDQFNLRKRHPVGRLHLLKNVLQSHLARRFHRCALDVGYGGSDGQKLDIFPAGDAGSPVLVFIHGGYFRALDKSQYRYLANQFVKRGYTVVLVNYDLAPKVPVSEIVQQVVRSFEWVRTNIDRWNGDPDQITLCGHSVGAFLAVKILEKEWAGGSGIKKAALLSGLYDLGPMRRSFLNRDVRLTDADVSDLNPGAGALRCAADILVAVGGEETGEFISQSRHYSQQLVNAGIQNDLMILKGINHYTMSRQLAQKRGPVIDWIAGEKVR